MSIRNILILVDFSEVTPALLSYGLQLASSRSARVWVRHIYYFPSNLAGEVRIPVDTLEEYEASIQQKFEELINRVTPPDLSAPHFTVVRGDLVEQVNQVIEQHSIDLVIVGNRGGGFPTNILGSHTLKIIYHAQCPVLSVPESLSFQPFRRMAFAADWQQTSPESIGQLKGWVTQWKASLDVIHVSTDEASKQVGLREPLGLDGVSYTLHFLWDRDIESGLENHITEHHNDLLVLLPRRHSFFDRLFQKSITRQMIYHSQLPVLTLRE